MALTRYQKLRALDHARISINRASAKFDVTKSLVRTKIDALFLFGGCGVREIKIKELVLTIVRFLAPPTENALKDVLSLIQEDCKKLAAEGIIKITEDEIEIIPDFIDVSEIRNYSESSPS